jgi:hypothetical protein
MIDMQDLLKILSRKKNLIYCKRKFTQADIAMINKKGIIINSVIIVTVLIYCLFSVAYANISIHFPCAKKYSSLSSNLNRKKILFTAVKTIPDDLTGIIKFPFKHPKISLPFIAATIGLIAVDRQTTEFVQRKINPQLTWVPPPLIANGTDGYMLFGLGTLYAGASLFNSPVNQIAALAAIKSLGYSVLITQLTLKTIFGRLRPNPNLSSGTAAPFPYSNNPLDFFQRNGMSLFSKNTDTSMPSFHFTMYFAVGTALSQVYRSYVPYLVTAAGLLPNFSGHHHWVSDMFVGGGLGVLIGYVTANNLKKNLSCGDKSVGTLTPVLLKDGVALSYNINFSQ